MLEGQLNGKDYRRASQARKVFRMIQRRLEPETIPQDLEVSNGQWTGLSTHIRTRERSFLRQNALQPGNTIENAFLHLLRCNFTKRSESSREGKIRPFYLRCCYNIIPIKAKASDSGAESGPETYFLTPNYTSSRLPFSLS